MGQQDGRSAHRSPARLIPWRESSWSSIAVPYPPDKGEKIRAYHMLRHLARKHELHLLAFVDDPADLEPARELERWCASLRLVRLTGLQRGLRMAMAMISGKALSIAVNEDDTARDWIADRVARGVDLVLGYSAAVAPLIGDDTPLIMDLVDCDSEKWHQLAVSDRSWRRRIYAREAQLVRRLERKTAERARATLLVSEPEAELCREIAPLAWRRIHAISNGVDLEAFDPATPWTDPYPGDGRPALVFTGVMNYAPNVQAIHWFHEQVWPLLRAHPSRPRMAIVGSKPLPSISALAQGDDVLVTGRVADVQPYLRHAAIAVAPLRIARGIQNKVLEAMAMAMPVVATTAAAEGIDVSDGRHLVMRDGAEETAEAIGTLLLDAPGRAALGNAARALVEERYSWGSRLSALDRLIEKVPDPVSRSPVAA